MPYLSETISHDFYSCAQRHQQPPSTMPISTALQQLHYFLTIACKLCCNMVQIAWQYGIY